jgi:MFS family permease
VIETTIFVGQQQHGGLWRDRDFLRFWSAETLSLIGSQLSIVAIPLLAVTSLTATPFEMGVLNAAQFAPFLLLTLVAGVWVDKRRRLPMLIVTNFGRAVLFGLIPLAMAVKLLNIGLLATLVFLAGTLTVVFELAYQSYVPSLVGHEHLIDANGKLEGSRSFAQMSGPGTAGILVGTVGAPFVILLDTVTYLVSAVSLVFIRRTEPPPQPDTGPHRSLWVQVGHGLRLAVSNVYLRALGAEAAVYNLFNQMLWAVLILHLARGLHLHPIVIGLVADDRDGTVVYLTSLTKPAAPSLRIGALIARGPVMERMQALRLVDDFFVTRPLQEAALELISSPSWDRHVRRLAAALRERCRQLAAAVTRERPDWTIPRLPTGGLHLWIHLPGGADDTVVASVARQHGVAVSAGRRYFAAEPPGACLRMGFAATNNLTELIEGARRATHSTRPTGTSQGASMLTARV